MDVFECISSRRSIRKFLEVPVEWEKIGTIIDAGMLAPSSGNLQNWRFIVVKDEKKRMQLAEAALQQHWMNNAPVVIVVCSEMKKIRQFYGVRGERLYAVQNCAAAVQNMLLAANALDLGACWVGAFDENAVCRALSIPDDADMRPQAIIPIGYPDEKPAPQLRYRIENITYLEKWSRQNIGKIRDVDAVLWNYRVAERGIKLGKELVKGIERSTRQHRKRLLDRIKEKVKR
jgi:nitroreductase